MIRVSTGSDYFVGANQSRVDPTERRLSADSVEKLASKISSLSRLEKASATIKFWRPWREKSRRIDLYATS